MLLIKNGTLHDGKRGVHPQTDILIKDGLINTIDSSLEAPDARVIDAGGKHVFPGFINAISTWGAYGPAWDDNDVKEATDPVMPELNVVFAFDHDSMVFQEAFKYGVTAAGVAPDPSAVLGGQAAVFKTYGRSPYKMLVREKAAQVASVTAAPKEHYGKKQLMPMTKMGTFSLLSQALRKASIYDPGKEDASYDSKSDALLPVLSGDTPLFVNCSTKAEMDGIERVLSPYPEIRLVYTGAYMIDADRENVKSKKCQVILGDMTEAIKDDSSRVDYAGVKALIDGGADIAASCCGDYLAGGKENLLWNAMLLYKHGIDSETVLSMITSTPAKILGVEELIGSLETGKHADFSIWTDNPIERFTARLESVYIRGENLLEKERYVSCW